MIEPSRANVAKMTLVTTGAVVAEAAAPGDQVQVQVYRAA
jgi:hypothetical protein